MIRRIVRRPAPAGLVTRRPNRARKAKARKYKVVMESVTQQKKELRCVISFKAEAPPGYTFIPAGNPQLTTACKERCRAGGLTIYAVTTTPHLRSHGLSQHVHRIGFHFPSAVVSAACMDLGLYLTATGKAVPYYLAEDIAIGRRKRSNSEVSQTSLNTEAKEILRDLFPNIPEKDLGQIIKTAFRKGQRKVGTANELPLARRAQLAVVAHIRHVYTDYDRLLKTTSFHEARRLVEEPTLAKLVEWRGDDENGKKVLEDVFREVIVISDDEDSDLEEENPKNGDRIRSLEIVSSIARPEELRTSPIVYTRQSPPECQQGASDEEAPTGFRFVREIPKKRKIDRRGFIRYEAWDRALNRYRNRSSVTDHNRSADPQVPSRYDQHRLDDNADVRVRFSGPQISASLVPVVPRMPVSKPLRDCHENRSNAEGESYVESNFLHTFAPPYRQRCPDVVYLDRSHVVRREAIVPPPCGSPNTPVFTGEFGELHRPYPKNVELRSGTRVSFEGTNLDPRDRVMPSIEDSHRPSQESRYVEAGPVDCLTRTISGNFAIRSVTPGQVSHANDSQSHNTITDTDIRAQSPKRRRLKYGEAPRCDFRSVPASHGDEIQAVSKRSLAQDALPIYGRDAYSNGLTYLSPRQPAMLLASPEHSSYPYNASTPSLNRIPVGDSQTHRSRYYGVIESRVHHPVRLSPRPAVYSGFTHVGPVEGRINGADALHHFANLRTLHRPDNVPELPIRTSSFEMAEPTALNMLDKPDPRALASDGEPRKKYIYADDFVRPIDPLEYAMQRSYPQITHPAGHAQPQLTEFKRAVEPFRREYSDRNASDIYHFRSSQGYPAKGQDDTYMVRSKKR